MLGYTGRTRGKGGEIGQCHLGTNTAKGSDKRGNGKPKEKRTERKNGK
jgi:hypothetical protein